MFSGIWKNYGAPCTVRRYYLKETESSEEFPRAYYVANPNKTEEENKTNSRCITSPSCISDTVWSVSG